MDCRPLAWCCLEAVEWHLGEEVAKRPGLARLAPLPTRRPPILEDREFEFREVGSGEAPYALGPR